MIEIRNKEFRYGINEGVERLARSIILESTDNNLDVMKFAVCFAYDAIVSMTNETVGDKWLEQTGKIYSDLVKEYLVNHGELKFQPKQTEDDEGESK